MENNIQGKNIFVLIPALNEEESIGKVIKKIPDDIVSETIVINNGSTDSTVEVAKKAGATVLDESRKGYGHALVKGINYLSDRSPDILFLLTGTFPIFLRKFRKWSLLSLRKDMTLLLVHGCWENMNRGLCFHRQDSGTGCLQS